MSKKPQKSSPAAAAAASQCTTGQAADKRTQRHEVEQRATATANEMTNENQEQPQHIQSPQATPPPPPPPPMPNPRPDRKRSRPTTQARDQQKSVIKSEEGADLLQAEATKSARVQVRQRLHPAATCDPLQQARPAKTGPPGSAVANAVQQEQNICAACAKPIRERYLLMALDKRWHEDCLKCAGCDCRLGEVGSSLFTHADKLFCRRDFLRIFGRHGHCAACERPIPPYELVMRANEHAYHMDCFACQQCQYRFCVGDRYHLNEAHKIICLVCHSEHQVQHHRAAQSSTNTPTTTTTPPDQLLPNLSSPGHHLSPPEHDPRPGQQQQPPSQDSAEGDTSCGSEPEVTESPAALAGEQVAGLTIQNFAELTNQRTTITLKRAPPEESATDTLATSTATGRKRPSLASVQAAPTTNGQGQACVM